MKNALFLAASCAALAPFTAIAQTGPTALEDIIIVSGTALSHETEQSINPELAPLQGGDLTYVTARTPGGARIANGEVSGQMQYRGLFGERMNLRVDGQRFASGGPNLMDPAFHYAPTPLIAAVVIDRGVSPVSQGPGLAGGADAVFKKVGFTASQDAALGYDVTFGARSVNESLSTGGVVGAANDTWRFNLMGAWEEGDDTRFKGGTIATTAFERGVYGLSAGARTMAGELSLDVRRHEAGPAGNPPFPMDIQFIDTDFARLGYSHAFDGVTLTASLNYTDVSHLMDNFSDRPAPSDPMRYRATYAYGTTRGFEVALGCEAFGGGLSLGLDGDSVDHHARITNPNNLDFYVTPFPNITQERLGAFAEWTGMMGPVMSELGLRVDAHDYDAGEAITGPALTGGPVMLRDGFNGAERSGDDTTVDLVARLWTPEQNGVIWRATLAHKHKLPGYIQRFGWLPISASGGLADGNTYVGDLSLNPETALIAEAGFDYASTRAYARPTVFVRQIDDYIQGVAYDDTVGVADTTVEMVSGMNGDATPLRWANVDARLYGFDIDAGYDFTGPLRLDGVFSYVRGERRDIDDNLYRVSPPSLTLGLTWEQIAWSATFETRAVGEQDKVSLTNSEAQTPGYVVLNAHGDWQVKDGVRISAGIENLLDHQYRDHLAGYNRNGFSDVAVGERVPGAGRGVFVRLSISR